MGKIISVWSYKHGWGSSSILSLLAKMIADKSKQNILCIDLQQKYGTLSQYMCNEDKRDDVNINGLLTIAESGYLNDDLINSHIQSTSIPNLKLIVGGRTGQFSYLNKLVEKDRKVLIDLLSKLKDKFDFILIDVPSGVEGMGSKFILEQSDVIVNVMKQERVHLSNFHNGLEVGHNAFLSHENVVGVLNYYDDSLSITSEFIKKELNIKHLVSLVYDSNLREYINEGKLVDLDTNKYMATFDSLLCMIFENCSIDSEDDGISTIKRKGNIFSIFGKQRGVKN